MDAWDTDTLKKINYVFDMHLTAEKVKSDLKHVCFMSGATGFEHEMADMLVSFMSRYCDKADVAIGGNMIGFRRPHSKKADRNMVLISHVDEVALIATGIIDDRFVRINRVSGVDAAILLSQEVIIHGRKQIPGVIVSKPAYLMSEKERKSPPQMTDLAIDTGMQGDMLRSLVSVGDIVTYKPVFRELLNNRICTKSLDNRVHVTVMIEAMQMLKELQETGIEPSCNVFAVAAKQEETTLSGGFTAAGNIKADIAVAFDVCLSDAHEMPDSYILGKGPTIGTGPIIDKGISAMMLKIAEEYGIPHQRLFEYTGTEAWAIGTSNGGVPCGVMSIPLRYMHSPVEMVQIDDVINAVKIMTHFILMQ